MIVCHCNVLTKADILATLADEQAGAPRSAVQAIRCLGCAPDCGRCIRTVRQLLADARAGACMVGCATCPARDHAPLPDEMQPQVLLAAE